MATVKAKWVIDTSGRNATITAIDSSIWLRYSSSIGSGYMRELSAGSSVTIEDWYVFCLYETEPTPQDGNKPYLIVVDGPSAARCFFWNSDGFHSLYNNSYKEYEYFLTNDYGNSIKELTVTADNGINQVLYNNVTYDTFPATIPLDPAATTMQVESKSPVVTINDGGNLKSVTYGSATYTKFPATVTATTPEFAVTARGKDSPVITVRTERTQTPVITNT